MSTSTDEHRAAARGQSAACVVLTVSDTRTEADDRGGALIRQRLTDAGHTVADHRIVRDDPDAVAGQLQAWLDGLRPDAVLTTGGTGIAARDTTVEVARRFITKELEGFGELFRMLSWQEVGPAAMLSRAVAGLAGDALLFCMPGSTNAVDLAMTRLIIPELPHLIWERKR